MEDVVVWVYLLNIFLFKTRKSYEECYIDAREELILTNSSMIASGQGRVGEWFKPGGC